MSELNLYMPSCTKKFPFTTKVIVDRVRAKIPRPDGTTVDCAAIKVYTEEGELIAQSFDVWCERCHVKQAVSFGAEFLCAGCLPPAPPAKAAK